jgi:hypothetical protein
VILALTDHQETLYVAIIAAVSSIATAYLSRQNNKKVNDVHDIVERRTNAPPPDGQPVPQRRSDDQGPA